MSIAPQDRPISVLREETIDQLVVNYAHGKLSLEAFERRLDSALETESHATLVSLTADLELEADKSYETEKDELLRPRVNPGSPRAKDTDTMVHVFGGSNRSGRWTVAEDISMFNLFGGGELDFTDAEFSSYETTVQIWSLFGGATIYVPENVNTVSKAVCIFGGIDNKAPATDAPGTPTIVIEGLLLFSGISIKVKKTWREHWLDFAENVRSMFIPTERSRP